MNARFLMSAAALALACGSALAQSNIRFADTLSANDTHNQAARRMAGDRLSPHHELEAAGAYAG